MTKHYFITYEEAQKVMPLALYVSRHWKTKDVKEKAGKIYQELSYVRKDVDYEPLRGNQVILSGKEAELFEGLLQIAGIEIPS